MAEAGSIDLHSCRNLWISNPSQSLSDSYFQIGRERVVSNPKRQRTVPLVFKTRLHTCVNHSPYWLREWDSNPPQFRLTAGRIHLESYPSIFFLSSTFCFRLNAFRDFL